MRKRIVVYYSLTGNTKEVAEVVADKLGADIVILKTVKPIPKSEGKKFMIGGMQAMFGMKPAIENITTTFSKYDEVILGTPIWAGKNAPAINTFLKDRTIREKVTGVFTCSAGGDNDKCMEVLKKKLPNLRCSVALADRNNEVAKDNEAKTLRFVEEVQRG